MFKYLASAGLSDLIVYFISDMGVSQKPDTVTYIQSQAEHHKKHSFEEEFLAFLKKHSIDYDPKYVWG